VVEQVSSPKLLSDDGKISNVSVRRGEELNCGNWFYYDTSLNVGAFWKGQMKLGIEHPDGSLYHLV